MKKHLLLIILVLISFTAISQTQVKTYMNVCGVWDEDKGGYEYGNKTFSRITFTLYERVIISSDKSNSVYRVKSDKTSDENKKWRSAAWECVDEMNRECIFLVMYHKNSDAITISISYGAISFIYYVDTE